VSQVEKRNPQSEFRNPKSGGVFPRPGRSIRAKLLVAFLVLSIIPMSATSYYNLSQSQREIAGTARENLAEVSRGTARHIEQLLIENQRTSATLAGEPLAAEFLAASEEERQALAPRAHLMLQNFADTHPDYDAPGLLDVNGIVLASLEEKLLGKDCSFRDYFQASIQGEPYISSMLVGRAPRRPGVFLTNPVRTTEGEIAGIDIVWLKADTIWSIVDDTTVGEEGICYLVDQDGVIIAHPDRDLLYHSLGELTLEAVAIITDTIRFGTIEGTDTPLVPESLGMDELAATLTAVPGPGTLQYQSPLDMSGHVAGHTRLEAVPWTVVVDLPEAQFLAPIKRLSSIAWLNMGLLALAVVGISILLSRSITRPVRRLTEAAAAVERDQPFEPQDIEDVTRGGDEISHLGRTFSNMVQSLRSLSGKLQEELAERQRAEEELEKHREHLEEMVEQRTRELKEAQEELVRKGKLAILGQLAGGVGHELRNPLAVISNAVYFLQATLSEADETTREYLNIIGSEVSNAGKIVSDLLDFSRSRPAEREEVAASELVSQALDRYPPPEGVEVSTEIAPDLPLVFVDASQIGQVLVNLLSNAYQAMPEGGKLTISAGLAQDVPIPIPHSALRNRQSAIRTPHSAVRIRVSDSGCGISKENIGKIFEPLFTTRARGIGLGLAVSRNLVEANGGSISVQSQEGQGSIFTVVLPSREAAV